MSAETVSFRRLHRHPLSPRCSYFCNPSPALHSQEAAARHRGCRGAAHGAIAMSASSRDGRRQGAGCILADGEVRASHPHDTIRTPTISLLPLRFLIHPPFHQVYGGGGKKGVNPRHQDFLRRRCANGASTPIRPTDYQRKPHPSFPFPSPPGGQGRGCSLGSGVRWRHRPSRRQCARGLCSRWRLLRLLRLLRVLRLLRCSVRTVEIDEGEDR